MPPGGIAKRGSGYNCLVSDELPEAGVGADVPIDLEADPELLDDPDARAVLEALRSTSGRKHPAVEDEPAMQEAALDDVTYPDGGERRPSDDLTPRFSER